MIAIGRDTYDISQNLFDLTEASVVLLDLTSLDRDCHTCCIVSKVRGLIRKKLRNSYFVTKSESSFSALSTRKTLLRLLRFIHPIFHKLNFAL